MTATGNDGPAISPISSRDPQQRAFLEPLGRTDDWNPCRHEGDGASDHIARAMRRQRTNHEVRAIEGSREVGRRSNAVRKDQLGKIGRIRSPFGYCTCKRRIARPQTHAVAGAGEVHRKCGAETAGTQYRRVLRRCRLAHRPSIVSGTIVVGVQAVARRACALGARGSERLGAIEKAGRVSNVRGAAAAKLTLVKRHTIDQHRGQASLYWYC